MDSVKIAEQLKEELDNLRPIDAEAEKRIMQKFRLEWNYHSNKLEGNSYTFGETKMLLLYGLTAGGKPIRDHEEISGHNEAIETLIEVIKDKTPLTETFIRQLHKLILVKPQWVDAKTSDDKPTKRQIKVGEYKTEPNHVETETGEMFYFAEPIETPAKMQELIKWFNEKKKSININPIILAAEFHYKFILIHPFDDGNGRMARLLMNFILMQNGFSPVIFKDKDKENYIAVLRQADFGILEPFIEYIAQNLVHSLEIMIKGAKGEDIEEDDDLDKELALLDLDLKNVGLKSEKIRNLKTLQDVITGSLIPLIKKFVKDSQKFDRFYVKSSLSVNINSVTFTNLDINSLTSTLSNKLSINTESIVVHYYHEVFNKTNFDEFDYSSLFTIFFNHTKYIIQTREADLEYTKVYSEKLSNDEINIFVNYISNKHLEYIKNVKSNVNKELDKSD